MGWLEDKEEERKKKNASNSRSLVRERELLGRI